MMLILRGCGVVFAYQVCWDRRRTRAMPAASAR